MMKRIVAVLLSLCLGMAFFVDSARAHFVVQGPWAVELEEYGRVFFVTPPTCEWLVERYGEERMSIRSGLYYNTDPLVNIYYVDEHFLWPWDTVFLSRDGRYFVYVTSFIRTDCLYGRCEHCEHEELRFFADGRQVVSYRGMDLVAQSALAPSSSSTRLWMDWESIEHDQQRNTLSLQTVGWRDLTFDITTGEIIDPGELHSFEITDPDETQPPLLTTGIIAIMLIAAAIVLARRKRRIFRDRK